MSTSLTITPQVTAIAAGQTVRFTATGAKKVTWSAIGGTIDADGDFDAPFGAQSVTATVIATSREDSTLSATATVHVVAPGQVTGTANAQVALYTISPGAAASVSVQFGIDTNYGLTTWTQPVLQGGGTAGLFVAGMKANTVYHMRGVVQFSDGTQFFDADQGLPQAPFLPPNCRP